MGRDDSFEERWPDLARALDTILAKRGLDLHVREDLIQETALRLLQGWDRFDKTRSLVPLATTIALNAMRDGFRRSRREVLGPIDRPVPGGDVEREGLAQLELGRVVKAMAALSERHRHALIDCVSELSVPEADGLGIRTAATEFGPARSPAAVKMLRMRARRRLAVLLERTGVMVTTARLRLHRTFDEQFQTVAATAGAGAILLAGLSQPGMVPGATATPQSPPAASAPSGQASQGRAFEGWARLRATAQHAGEIGGGRGSVRGGSDGAGSPGRKDPDVEADAEGEIDPWGDSFVRIDAGFAYLEARRTRENDASACVWIGTETDERDCGERSRDDSEKTTLMGKAPGA